MKIEENISLVPFTTLRVGGPARFFVRARSAQEVAEALTWVHERSMPAFVLGGGTNVLVPDEGFEGLIIKIENSDLEVREDGTILVGAGVPMGRLMQEAARASLTGLEWAAGLPGTVGGAIFGNAGAFGHETGEFVREASGVDQEGRLLRFARNDVKEATGLAFRYRWSSFQDWSGTVILSVVFQLQLGHSDEIAAAMRLTTAARYTYQPLADQSAGCIFKNPSAQQPAGKLIDGCGLKGMRIGGAEVSDTHANFIVNRGMASARDINELIRFVKTRVHKKMGVMLEEEIRFVRPGEVRGSAF